MRITITVAVHYDMDLADGADAEERGKTHAAELWTALHNLRYPTEIELLDSAVEGVSVAEGVSALIQARRTGEGADGMLEDLARDLKAKVEGPDK